MSPLDLQGAYYTFIKEHRAQITDVLRLEYTKFLDASKSSILFRLDFGFFVGIPLFIFGVAWAVSTTAINDWIIAAVMIAFGFWLKYYQKYIFGVTCRHFFDFGKGKLIIEEYIIRCRDNPPGVASELDPADRSELFEYCLTNTWPHDFRYYK